MTRAIAAPVATLLFLGFASSATPAIAQVCGDANGDQQVGVTDGVQTLRAAAGLSSQCQLATCDVDGDGRISLTDGVNVLRAAAGLAAVLACPGSNDEFLERVTRDDNVPGSFVFGPIVKAPLSAPVTIGAVRAASRVLPGSRSSFEIEYDDSQVVAQGTGGNRNLLVASRRAGGEAKNGLFTLPLEQSQGQVSILLDVRNDVPVETFEIDFATGSGTEVQSAVRTVIVVIITQQPPLCGNRLFDANEQCDPPGLRCDAGFCNDQCRCEPLPTPTPAVCGNGLREASEQCDGADDAQCGPEPCLNDICKCRPSVCVENDACTGKPTVVACILAGDDSDTAGARGNPSFTGPFLFGSWSNPQCATSGSGWHSPLGTCGSGAGSGDKRCQHVIASSISVSACGEEDPCTGGEVFACILAGDDSDTAAFAGQPDVRPGISFGSWSNPQCGIAGNGWHLDGIGTCGGGGGGSGTKRCKFVLRAFP